MKQFNRIAVFFIVIALALSVTAFAADGKLVQVVMLTRHGDRTPFTQIEKSPIDWSNGASELTAVGMSEHYKLGQQLRKRYIDTLALLPDCYQSGVMYVLSSDTNRTIMSAESLLYGLYPLGTGPLLDSGMAALPQRFQPIPIRTVAADSGAIMLPYDRYMAVMQQYVWNQPQWTSIESSSQAKYAQWSKILGNKISSLNDVMTVGDVLIVRDAHGIALPNGLSRKQADEIIEMTERALADEFRSPKAAALCGDELLDRMAVSINDMVNGKSTYKLVYYSGHDISRLPVMTLLGKPLQHTPGYAAHMELELYQSDKNYSVKLRYNDSEVAEYPLAKFNQLVAAADKLVKN